jgi:hypothetical protein
MAGDGTSLFVVRYTSGGTVTAAEAIVAQFLPGQFFADLQLGAMHLAGDGSLYVGGRFQGQVLFGGDTLRTPVGGMFPIQYAYLLRFAPTQQADWAQAFPSAQNSGSDPRVLASDAQGQV